MVDSDEDSGQHREISAHAPNLTSPINRISPEANHDVVQTRLLGRARKNASFYYGGTSATIYEGKRSKVDTCVSLCDEWGP